MKVLDVENFACEVTSFTFSQHSNLKAKLINIHKKKNKQKTAGSTYTYQ
jgi:hypothetical protein